VSKWAGRTLSDAEFNRNATAVEHAKLYHAKVEQLLERAGVRESDGEEAINGPMYDAEGKMSPMLGRLLVEWYLEGCRAHAGDGLPVKPRAPFPTLSPLPGSDRVSLDT